MNYPNQMYHPNEYPSQSHSQTQTSTFSVFMTIFIIIFLITIMSVVLSYMGWTSEQVFIVMIIITVFIILPCGAIYYWSSKPSVSQSNEYAYGPHNSPSQQNYQPMPNVPFNINPSNTKNALLTLGSKYANPEMVKMMDAMGHTYNQATDQFNNTMNNVKKYADNMQNKFQTGYNSMNSFFNKNR